MPTYEYACDKCDHEFEVEQRITDDPVKSCPKCRSRKVKRLISQTSFVLKGGGWYETDFKKDNQRNLVDSPDEKGAGKSEPADKKSGDSAQPGEAAKGTEKKPARTRGHSGARSTEG